MTFSPRTWVVGETVTAAMLNAEIRDQLNSMFDVWTSFTPVWSSSGTAPAIGNGSIVGRYMKIGRTVHAVIRMTCGATTTYGTGSYSWTLPFTASNTIADYLGEARLVGASAWHGQAVLSANSNLVSALLPGNATSTLSTAMTGTTPKTVLSGDILRIQIAYQSTT